MLTGQPTQRDEKWKLAHIAEYRDYKERRLIECIHVDLTGAIATIVTCKICKKTMEILQTAEFVPYRIWTGNNKFSGLRQKMLKNPKEAMKHFQDVHWVSCIDRFEK